MFCITTKYLKLKLIDTLVGLATNTDLCMFVDILANGDIDMISRLLRTGDWDIDITQSLLKVTRNQYNQEFRDWPEMKHTKSDDSEFYTS